MLTKRMKMTILILDGQNLLHRARSGFQLGSYNVVFNFFRSLKPLIEKFKPSKVYFTLEGHPQKRYDLLPSYKANRIVDQTTDAGQQKQKSLEDFFRQKDVIVNLMAQYFPICIVRHPHYEADDVIYNIIDTNQAAEYVVVSTDSDFTQLLQQFDKVKLYNPVTKKFVVAPEYDYVLWKALNGDPTDNIPRIQGMTDAKAVALADIDLLMEFCDTHEDLKADIRRNIELVQFAPFSQNDINVIERSKATKNWKVVKSAFETWEFKSMTKDSYWQQFQSVFDTLWD